MRILEVLLVLISLFALAALAMRLPRRGVQFAVLAGLLALAVHLLVEGWRWQMMGIYVLVLVLFLIALLPRQRVPQNPSLAARFSLWRVLSSVLLAGVLVALLTAPAILFPIPRVPEPSGRYAVGTWTRMLVDESRMELYSGRPNEPRRVLIQVWYPAADTAGLRAAPWMPAAEQVAPQIARWLGLPSFTLGHLRYVTMPSYLEAPIATDEATYPVLLFSHGWGGFRSQSSFLMHELASHGYVVVALEHPYGAVFTVFPDGSVAANNPDALPLEAPEAELEQAAQRLGDQWAGDLSFVLDELAWLNTSDGPFQGRLDLNRVGAMGHSTGGGAIIEFCGRDPRCRAGLGLDTWMRPVGEQRRQAGVPQPFLFMFSELWPTPTNDSLFNELIANSPSALRLTITGTDHYDFSDLPMLTPIAAQLGLKGPLNGARVMQIISTYSLAFFDRVFKDLPTNLFDGPSFDFPEVILWLSL